MQTKEYLEILANQQENLKKHEANLLQQKYKLEKLKNEYSTQVEINYNLQNTEDAKPKNKEEPEKPSHNTSKTSSISNINKNVNELNNGFIQLSFNFPLSNTSDASNNVNNPETSILQKKKQEEIENYHSDKKDADYFCLTCHAPISVTKTICPKCGRLNDSYLLDEVLVINPERIRISNGRYILLENNNQRNGVLLIDGYYKGPDFNFIYLSDAATLKCGVYSKEEQRIIRLTQTTKYYLECYYSTAKIRQGNYPYVSLTDFSKPPAKQETLPLF